MLYRTGLAAAWLLLAAAPAGAGERAAAEVACEPTAEPLVYACAIAVTARKSAEPVLADALTVKADMPSMPMAHNLPPVAAMPVAGAPGRYTVLLELEMHGEWALAIEVDGKTADSARRVRDKAVVKRQFTAAPDR